MGNSVSSGEEGRKLFPALLLPTMCCDLCFSLILSLFSYLCHDRTSSHITEVGAGGSLTSIYFFIVKLFIIIIKNTSWVKYCQLLCVKVQSGNTGSALSLLSRGRGVTAVCGTLTLSMYLKPGFSNKTV